MLPEPDQIGADAEGVQWIRSGSCNRCGECCFGDPFNGGEGAPAVPGACPLLRRDGDKYLCSNREHPYYLGGCNVWPSIPQHIVDYPSCSYTFRRAG